MTGGHDIVVGGLFLSSFVGDAVGALIVFLLVRPLAERAGFSRYVANPPLAELALYVCILGLFVVFV